MILVVTALARVRGVAELKQINRGDVVDELPLGGGLKVAGELEGTVSVCCLKSTPVPATWPACLYSSALHAELITATRKQTPHGTAKRQAAALQKQS